MNKIIIIVLAVAVLTSIIGVNTVFAEEGKVPSWIKIIFSAYIQGITTDEELIDALEILIEDDIIQIGEKDYEPWSLEKFPNTGGFNPEWLKGEREDILKACQESKADGYEMIYCKYVQ